jgi:hypothetical protein
MNAESGSSMRTHAKGQMRRTNPPRVQLLRDDDDANKGRQVAVGTTKKLAAPICWVIRQKCAPSLAKWSRTSFQDATRGYAVSPVL